METIKQKDYLQLEIDCREQDIIQVWMNGKDDSNVIQIEKSNLQALIDLLKREADSFKNLNKAPVMRSVCSFCGFPKIVWWNSGQKYLCGKCGKEQTAA